jgi:hypothetical protein
VCRAALATAIAVGALVATTGAAPAATFVVDESDDLAADGSTGNGVCDAAPGSLISCTLRAAVQEANGTVGPDTIQLPDAGAPYALSRMGGGEDFAATGDLDLRTQLTIAGSGEPVINGLGADRVFHVGPGSTGPVVTLTGVEVRDGGGVSAGGGIYADSGTLSLSRVTVRDNDAVSASGAASGGGLLLEPGGQHSIVATTVSGNIVSGPTSAAGGGVATAPGTGLTVTNSTISGNAARSPAGGASGGGLLNGGATVLTHSTLHGNVAAGATGASGGSLAALSGSIALRATIVSGGVAESGFENCVADPPGEIATQGANLEAPASGVTSQCGLFTSAGDRLSPTAGLSALAPRGGPTQTHAPFSGSPALEAIPSCFPVTLDQRGQPRPGGVACEIGAYERQELPPPGAGCFGEPPTILGKPGVSRIVGSPRPDVILGARGREVITGGGGKDLICSGKGNDKLLGGPSRDQIAGQDGKDRLFGEEGKDHLLGNSGRDVLDGGAGPDLLNGGGRRDSCRGGREDTLKRC